MTLVNHLYTRVMRKGRLIGLILLSAAPGITLMLASLDTGESNFADEYATVVGEAGFAFAIAALIMAAATLREERDGGTLPYLYMRPIPRSELSILSIAAGTYAAATLGVIAWISTVIASIARGATVSDALPGLVLFLTASFGYAAIFVPLGYLVRRSLLFGLGYLFVIEAIVANVIGGLAQLSVWKISLSIYLGIDPNVSDSVADNLLGPVGRGAGGGIAKLAVLVALGYLILTWAMRRRDAL